MEPPGFPPGYRLIVLETVGSTNDEARRLAEQGAPDGTVVWAREQSAGRGRLGRGWTSPPGNLYASLILRPRVAPRAAPELSFVAAVAVADTLAGLAPKAPVQLKWPNDVLLGDRKITGILLETTSGPEGSLAFVVLGIGINVARHPDDARYGATDLAAEGVAIGVEAVLGALAGHLSGWIGRWLADGFAPVRAAWLARAPSRGAVLDVRLGNTLISGTFCDLDGDGAMILEIPGGERRRITAGDVAAPTAPRA
jgi:BirA family biotin operon repressor/biotin-[acetyl-CoA-carboxylase] ligase